MSTIGVPRIIGEVEIPNNRYQKDGINKASFARTLLSQVPEDKALMVEFDSKKEADNMRSMLYSVAIWKFGEAGHIATSIQEKTMYIWLKKQNNQSAIAVDMTVFQNSK